MQKSAGKSNFRKPPEAKNDYGRNPASVRKLLVLGCKTVRIPVLNLDYASVYHTMSAKHQENDTPVKASHLLLVIAVCQVLVPEHCLLGEPPKHEKFVSFHKSSVEW